MPIFCGICLAAGSLLSTIGALQVKGKVAFPSFGQKQRGAAPEARKPNVAGQMNLGGDGMKLPSFLYLF